MMEFVPVTDAIDKPAAVIQMGAVSDLHKMSEPQRKAIAALAKEVTNDAIRLWMDQKMDFTEAMLNACAARFATIIARDIERGQKNLEIVAAVTALHRYRRDADPPHVDLRSILDRLEKACGL